MISLLTLAIALGYGSYMLSKKHKQGTFKTIQFYHQIPIVGRYLLPWIMTFATPYSGTIPFRLNTFSLNICETEMVTRFWMMNPFNSCHVAALLNFGELTQGLLVIANAENLNKRAIPTKITIECFIKARGKLYAKSELPATFRQAESQDIITNIFNTENKVVAKVTGTWAVSAVPQNPKIDKKLG